MIWITWGLSVLVAGFVGFLTSYLNKKGENLATHEDIRLLVDQVRAVTQATKEIEAKISDDSWDRQKRWEIKRDVMLEVGKQIGLVKDALGRLYGVYQTEIQNEKEGKPARLQKRIEVGDAWNDAIEGLERAMLLADLSCEQEVGKALLAFDGFARNIRQEITEGRPEAFMASTKELVEKLSTVTKAMRKEIGTDKS